MTKDDAIKVIEETRSFWEAEAAKAFSAKKPQVYAVAMHTERQFKKLIDAFRALPDAGWRDISIAPKDGTRILLAMTDRLGEQMVYEGRWNEDQKQFTSTNGFLIFDNCTHWMPLPPPPEKA